jgi:hypothetical protein
MNPFRSVTPWDYEEALWWMGIFLAFVVLGGAWLIWAWRYRVPGKNHLAYASVAVVLVAFVPLEQLLGPWLAANQAYRLTRWTHFGRYVCSGLSVLLALIGLFRVYFHFHGWRRINGGQLAGAIGLVLGALVGIFTYTQQIWRIENPPFVRPIPNHPYARGGRPYMNPTWGFGFIVPTREWSQELAAVSPDENVVELVERTLKAHTRVYAEHGTPSLLVLRDHCLADLRALNPEVVVEKEENKTINELEATRLEARIVQDGVERHVCCTVLVAKSTGSAFRIVSWAPAAVYPQVKADIELIHESFQMLRRQ